MTSEELDTMLLDFDYFDGFDNFFNTTQGTSSHIALHVYYFSSFFI